MAEAKSFNVNGTEIILKDEYARKEIKKTNEHLNNIANKKIDDITLSNNVLTLLANSKTIKTITLPTSTTGGGTNAREIELQASTDYIQWRYVGDTGWTNLVALSSLKGADGDTGLSAYELAQQEIGFAGTVEQWLNSLVGATPNLQIGTVETLESGSSATASITGTTENPLLNLGIPKGADGTSGTGGSSEKEWTELLNTELTEDIEVIQLDNLDVTELYVIIAPMGTTANTTTSVGCSLQIGNDSVSGYHNAVTVLKSVYGTTVEKIWNKTIIELKLEGNIVKGRAGYESGYWDINLYSNNPGIRGYQLSNTWTMSEITYKKINKIRLFDTWGSACKFGVGSLIRILGR